MPCVKSKLWGEKKANLLDYKAKFWVDELKIMKNSQNFGIIPQDFGVLKSKLYDIELIIMRSFNQNSEIMNLKLWGKFTIIIIIIINQNYEIKVKNLRQKSHNFGIITFKILK